MAGDGLRRILLVGFMASGKTSVGRELAALLGWRFLDFDVAIEERAGLTVSEIFDQEGEEYFRQLESEVARTLLHEEEAVLATGGGWPAQPGSWEAVPEGTLSVWLRVSPGVAVLRASSEGLVRPLLEGEDAMELATALLAERGSAYGRAQIALDSDREDPATLATRIMKIVRGQDTKHR